MCAPSRACGAGRRHDIIVISTKDGTLVARRGESGAVKEVVQELAANGRDEADHHLTVHRP